MASARPGFNAPTGRTTWMRDAACIGTGDLAYGQFDEKHYYFQYGPNVTRSAQWFIRSYCLNCTVILECRERGKSEEYGIWGGLTPQERSFRRAKAEQ